MIHQDIFDSSLAVDYEARHLFQDLIVLCDAEDNVMMDPLRIAYRTRIPIDVVRRGLEFLTSPDNQTKGDLSDGRRITEIRNKQESVIGYHVVNRHHYKRMMTVARRREYMRRYRARKMEESRRGAV